MTAVTIPNTQGDIQIGEFTGDGNGVFDIMLGSVQKILKEDLEKGRIRQTDYANALVQLIPAILQQASAYTLAKAKLPLELQEIEANIQKIATDTAVATKQGALIDAQTSQVLAEINRINTELKIKLPREIEQLDAQTFSIKKETELKDYQLNTVLPKQVEQTDAQILNQNKQTELLNYDLTNIKPKELAIKQNEADLGLKEIALKQNQIDLGIKQLALAEKDLGIKEQQLKLAEFEFTTKAPAEVASVNAQTDLYKQKTITEKAQTDSSAVLPNSVIDYQNKLIAEQTKSYFRDAVQKNASLFFDTWKVRYNTDPSINVVNEINKLHDANVGVVADSLLASIR